MKIRFGLRLKIVAILLLVLTAFAAVTTSLFHQQSIRAAEAQEQTEATQNLRRILLAMDFQLAQLDAVLGAWSNWTSLYEHAAHPTPKFVQEELGENGLAQAKIDWLLRIDTQDRIADRIEIPARNDTRVLGRFIEENPVAVSAAIARIRATEPPNDCGLMILGQERSLFCFRPLLNSDGVGPSRGFVAVGRHLSDHLLGELGQQVGFNVTMVTPVERISAVPTGELINARITQAIPHMKVTDNELTIDYPIVGWFGKEAGALRIVMARSAMLRAEEARRRSTALLLTLILLTGSVMIAVIDFIVVQRVDSLRRQLGEIVESKTWDGKISRQGRDEIDQLGRFINRVIGVVREQMIELRELSLIDPMTKLANRRWFDEKYGDALRRHQRNRQPLALVLLDADCFKKYNDQYGHPAGDAALVVIAQSLQQNARRPGDLAARLGGEEFALLLEDTDFNGARHCAEGVLKAMSAAALSHAGNPPYGIMTLSVGIALQTPSDTPESLYHRADQALYQAKTGGRNRVHIAGTEATTEVLS